MHKRQLKNVNVHALIGSLCLGMDLSNHLDQQIKKIQKKYVKIFRPSKIPKFQEMNFLSF